MSKTILIVDDSSTVRQVVNLTLTGAGYQVIEAWDGKNALSKLDGQKIHLVISDINMAGMDGLTFVRELKKNEAYKFVPVVMLTTESSKDMKMQGKDAGVRGWIVKPFVPQQLLAAVGQLLLA